MLQLLLFSLFEVVVDKRLEYFDFLEKFLLQFKYDKLYLFIMPPSYFFFFTFFMFFLAIFGMLYKRYNLLYLLIFLEIIILSIIMDFFFISVFFQNGMGLVYGFIMLVLAAVESTVGLALIVVYFRQEGSVDFRFISRDQNFK